MSGRAQPLNGADSIDGLDVACPVCDATYAVYETHECAPLKRYRVLVCDRWDKDTRFYIEVAAVIGHDARSQVRTDHPDWSVLNVEEVAA